MTADAIKQTLGQYTEFSAPKALAPFIDYVWVYEGFEDQDPETFHRILPDPDSSIMLRAHWQDGRRPERSRVEFHGPILQPYLYHPCNTETLVAAKVKSEWLLPLLGTRGDDVANYSGALKPLDKGLSGRLLTGLENTAAWPEAMEGLIKTLIEVCHDKGLVDMMENKGLVQRAAGLARQASGTITTSTLAGSLDISKRHLYRCFRGEVGISPKEISRRFRFLTAVGMADNVSSPNWAGIACEAGYFDQSHMIREFKALCALTPRAVYSERRAESALAA